MLRAFVAVALPQEVVGKIAGLLAEFKATRADVRWVGSEGIHLTLKFLGDIEADAVPGVLTALGAALSELAPLEVEVRGLGAFPSLRRPRVLWVGCEGKGLLALAEATDTALATVGFSRDPRPFKPHITLGRVRSMRAWGALERLVVGRAAERFGHSSVSQVILFRSVLTPQGARYSHLGSVRLAGEAATKAGNG